MDCPTLLITLFVIIFLIYRLQDCCDFANNFVTFISASFQIRKVAIQYYMNVCPVRMFQC